MGVVNDSHVLVYCIILNWNGWRDTIECLESVQRLAYPNYRIVVVDNGSSDGSTDRIKAWAAGQLSVESKFFGCDPSTKPVGWTEYDRADGEAGGRRELEAGSEGLPPNRQMVIIQTGANLGFAGGNNVGLRYALAKGNFGYVWLLNNDTVVERDSLTQMVRRMQEKPDAGMCGSTLVYYHEPEKVQALGGSTYNKWLGHGRAILVPSGVGPSKPVNPFQPASQPMDAERVERELACIVGASMLVSKSFLHDVGLMSEDFFLYFEDIDWAMRARGRYALAYAPESIVYHKVGASIGSSSRPKEKSSTADYYGMKNRLVITRKHFPWALPTVYLGLLITMLNRVRRGQWDRVGMALKIMVNNWNL